MVAHSYLMNSWYRCVHWVSKQSWLTHVFLVMTVTSSQIPPIRLTGSVTVLPMSIRYSHTVDTDIINVFVFNC